MARNEPIATWLIRAAAAVLMAIVTPGRDACAAEDEFYKGKQIRLVISSAAGGVYDTFGRLIARFLPAYLPGRPTIVVQNMPGASGLKATNYIYNNAPRDGTVIDGVHNRIPTAPFEAPKPTHFAGHNLSCIGGLTEDPLVAHASQTSPVQHA